MSEILTLSDNMEELKHIAALPPNWDNEGAVPFDADFIQELIGIITDLPVQPDIDATGRGSIDYEYGSARDGHNYLNIEIFQADFKVKVYQKDSFGDKANYFLSLSDIKGCVRCFLENDNICIPGFYENEQLPLGYFDPPDPYTNISSRKINLGGIADYMHSTGKSFRELTKEDLKMFEH